MGERRQRDTKRRLKGVKLHNDKMGEMKSATCRGYVMSYSCTYITCAYQFNIRHFMYMHTYTHTQEKAREQREKMVEFLIKMKRYLNFKYMMQHDDLCR